MNTIDADGHIVEKDIDMRKRLPEPYSKRTGGLLPSDGMDTNMGGSSAVWKEMMCRSAFETWTRKASMSRYCFPPAALPSSRIFERDYAVAYARAYNDFIAEVCKESPRLKAVALLPFQDPMRRSKRSTAR